MSTNITHVTSRTSSSGSPATAVACPWSVPASTTRRILRTQQLRRRLTGLATHLADRAVGISTFGSARSTIGASTAEHLARLERDGVTIVEEVYSKSQLAEIREALTAACEEVRAALPAVTWTEMRYQKELVEADTFW
jgi:hypothetical protein